MDTGLRKIRAFLLETGTEFQPDDAETVEVIREIGAAATQLCFGCFCASEVAKIRFELPIELDPLRRFRDDVLGKASAGRRYTRLFEKHGVELVLHAIKDEGFRKAASGVVTQAARLVEVDGRQQQLDDALLRDVEQLMNRAAEGASPALANAIESVRADLPLFKGRTIAEALARASERDDK